MYALGMQRTSYRNISMSHMLSTRGGDTLMIATSWNGPTLWKDNVSSAKPEIDDRIEKSSWQHLVNVIN